MLRRSLIAAVVFVALAAPAFAHHGWTSYLDTEFALDGVIEEASLGATHGMLKVRSQGRLWDVMLAPPAAIQRSGLELRAVPRGARVTARGHRHTDPAKLEMKTERLTIAGKTYDLYPART